MLWGYEPSPFTRVVRERIVELEIPHLFKTTCRGSVKRQEMFDKYGKFQAPLLEVRPSPHILCARPVHRRPCMTCAVQHRMCPARCSGPCDRESASWHAVYCQGSDHIRSGLSVTTFVFCKMMCLNEVWKP